MVAYSFQKRFAPPILDGTKVHTIRAERRRHARPGEAMQLYTGMRTKVCKLILTPVCEAAVPVHMVFCRRGGAEIRIGGRLMAAVLLDAFARADGFADLADMVGFWWAAHPLEDGVTLTFQGVLLRWKPVASAASLSLPYALDMVA